MKNLTFLFLFFSFTTQPSAQELVFKKNGKVVRTLGHQEFKAGLRFSNGRLRPKNKEIYNSWRKVSKAYTGYSFYKILEGVYGDHWKRAKGIEFTALDGYRQKTTISKMLEASRDKIGWLSFKEKGSAGFSTFQRKNKTVDPGPFYLLWDNFKENYIPKHSDPLKWPYQLKSIHLKD